MTSEETTGIEILDRLAKAMGVDIPKHTPPKKSPPLSDEEWKEKYVYPPEHARRLRLKMQYEHIIPLLDAIEEIGKAICGKEWKGTPQKPYEWYARSFDEIKNWNRSRLRQARF